MIAVAKSNSGTANTAKGSKSGKAAGPMFSEKTAFASICPIKVIADAASTKPKYIEPESPMKIRAG